jgi:hypothetical protein
MGIKKIRDEHSMFVNFDAYLPPRKGRLEGVERVARLLATAVAVVLIGIALGRR